MECDQKYDGWSIDRAAWIVVRETVSGLDLLEEYDGETRQELIYVVSFYSVLYSIYLECFCFILHYGFYYLKFWQSFDMFVSYLMSCGCGIILSVLDMCMGDGIVFILKGFVVFLPNGRWQGKPPMFKCYSGSFWNNTLGYFKLEPVEHGNQWLDMTIDPIYGCCNQVLICEPWPID